MSDKRSKYDTDPLDPDFVRQTEAIGGGASSRDTARTPNEQARLNPDADAPTRRIDDALAQPYQSVFAPPAQTPTTPPPPTYQQPTYQQPPYQQPTYQQPTYQPTAPANLGRPAPMPGAPHAAPPTSRPVAGLGIPENLALVLPYAPFYIGLVVAILELLFVPRHETRVRFHAAQGLALQLVMTAISFAFGIIGNFTGSAFGGRLFWLACFIFLIMSIIRVWKGETHHLAPLDEATTWLYEHIKPRN
jgi:uncharacterized membrane protein